MRSASIIKVWLVLVAISAASAVMAADAPWSIDNIVKTGSVEATEPTADGTCLQIELKVDPSQKNVPWHNFKIVDVSGAAVGTLDSWDEESGTLFFEGDWSKVVGLYLEGAGVRQELFPNAVVEDVQPITPVAPVIQPEIVNNVPTYPVRYTEPVARTERHVVGGVDRVVNVHHNGVRTYVDNDRTVYVDDDNHVIHHGGDVIHHDDVIHHGGSGVGGGKGCGNGSGSGSGDDCGCDDEKTADSGKDSGKGGTCDCGDCDGKHGPGCSCSDCAGKGEGEGSGSGDGCGCKACGGKGCPKCGSGPGSPWEMDSYAKACGQGNKLAMGSGEGTCDEGEGCEGEGEGEGEGSGPGEGEGPCPDEGEGPCPDEGEGPAPGEGPGTAPGEGCGCGPEPGMNPLEPTAPDMNPAAPGTGPGCGCGPNMIGPNYKNMAPQIRPRVKNLAKNFLPDPPVIDGPEIFVYNPQKPYYNPQMPYYGMGYGYGGGPGMGGGGGGTLGNIPEGAFDFKKPEYEEHFVLYISCGTDKTEGTVYQVNENGRILGQVRLPFTATGLAIHRDTGLVCAAPRDGGKIYRINDAGIMSTVMEDNESVVHPSDVAIGYNTDSMVLADDLSKTLSVTNTAGVKPTTYKRLKGGKYEQPEMSVAAGRDKAVLFSSSDNPGIYRYTGNATETEPILPKSGAVAASNATDKWAATQGDDIVVMEGVEEQYMYEVPKPYNVYKNGMLSFAPRDSVVVAAKRADGSNENPWLIQFSKDENGETKVRSLFEWDQSKGEMQDFVVGPRMYWEQNNRKTMKSMY